jgi:thioredoxin-related protein
MSSRWLFPFSVLVCAVLAGSASAQQVEWRQNYNRARKEAEEKNRPLLLDFGTESCFWCKKLDTTTLREPAIANLLNQRFVPLRIDANRDHVLVEALKIQGFPTLVLAAPDGKILGLLEGYQDAPHLQAQLQRVLAGLDNALAKSAEVKAQHRLQRGRELLAQARDSFSTQQYLLCLNCCDLLAAGYADLPEAKEASRLAAQIKNEPEALQKACEKMADQLGVLYLELAEALLKQGQGQQAAAYLEKVIRLCPNTTQAELAQVRLTEVQRRPTWQAEFKKP